MKYVLVIGDGMADTRLPQLAGKTPLEALALLKGLPAGAALVAAAVVGGTLALTGKHGGSPFCGAGGTVPVQCRPDQSPTATMAL